MGVEKESLKGFNLRRFRSGLRVMFSSTLLASAGVMLFLVIQFSIGAETRTFEISRNLVAPALGFIAEAGLVVGRLICAWAAGTGGRKWFLYSLLAEAIALLIGLSSLVFIGSTWQLVLVGVMMLPLLVSVLLLIHGLNHAARLVDRQRLVQGSRRFFDFVIVSSLFIVMATVLFFWVDRLRNVDPSLLIFATIVGFVILVNWVRFICLLEDFVRRFPSGEKSAIRTDE